MALTQVQPGMLGTPQPNNFKNRIINGAMVVNQRGTAATADAQYSVDRWRLVKSNDATESANQNTDAPAGFSYSLRDTISTGDGTIAAAQYAGFEQYIEGYNIADLNWGSANAKTIALSFWIRSSVTGQYTGNVRNSDDSRIFPFNYTISAANTWEYKTVTITGETSGTWLTTNGIGLKLALYSALGSNYTGGTNGAWGASPNYGCGTPVNGIASNGNIFAITGVQLEVGVSATGFDYRPYGTELVLCQRYYQKFVSTVSYGNLAYGKAYNGTTLNCYRTFYTPMRTTPSTFDSSAANTFFGENGSTSFVGSAIAINPFTTNPYQGGFDISITGATTGAFMSLVANNNAASYIAFGAEL